jgi:hypothetical protein
MCHKTQVTQTHGKPPNNISDPTSPDTNYFSGFTDGFDKLDNFFFMYPVKDALDLLEDQLGRWPYHNGQYSTHVPIFPLIALGLDLNDLDVI